MMKAVVPLNVAAVRVNNNDSTNIVGQFRGAVAAFQQLPYTSTATQASTGDQVIQALEYNSPQNKLGPGIHLHWELPDFFRRGVQPPIVGEDLTFPPTPNRFLVIRYISVYDTKAKQYGPVTTKCWIVESDHLSPSLSSDPYGVIRPAISVPIQPTPGRNIQPYMYMGRVADYASWNPMAEDKSQFLPAHAGTDGAALYLSSIGFVGPSFSAYYPECCSVFGFWDHFQDLPEIGPAIAANSPVQFKASYQVIGWINETASDPLANFAQMVTQQYNDYVAQCKNQNVAITRSPADFFSSLAQQKFQWTFNGQDVPFTLNADKTVATLGAPDGAICAGVIQEIVWNMLENTGTTYFLANMANSQANAVWTDNVELAIGNTTAEALSALLKKDVGNTSTDPDVLKNYEYLLDALQLGLLYGLEQQSNKIITLEETMHSKAFAKMSGGLLWIIQQMQPPSDAPVDADAEVTLPLVVAEKLSLLNQAQKAYDQGRAALDVMRKQLFMDWVRYVKMYVSNSSGNFSLSDIENFLSTSDSGELKAVVAAGDAAGLLQYNQDTTTFDIIGLAGQRPAAGTLADAVWTQVQAVTQALQATPSYQLRTVPAPPFWLPTDPVLLIEGDRVEPVRRNGATSTIGVRLSNEVTSKLAMQYGQSTFSVEAVSLTGAPAISANTPMQAEIQSLVGEAFLLTPTLAGAVSSALAVQGGGGNNPAIANAANFILSLQSAQGGLSPLAGGPGGGLYLAIRQDNYVAAANPTQTVSAPLQISFKFTNDAGAAWPPDPVGWNAQTALPEFSPSRCDPFLPVFLIWNVRFDPLKRNNGRNYSADNLTGYFPLNADAVDYTYTVAGGGASFTINNPVSYDDSIVLSRRSVQSLTRQIDTYIQNYGSGDKADPALEATKAAFLSRKFLSQALSGFNAEQVLRTYIAQIAVEDLPRGLRDAITLNINQAAGATANDNWYDFAFNSLEPIATGPQAQTNFGPLRSGFLEVSALEIVDAFGQRIQLLAPAADGNLAVTPAINLQPASGDAANQSKIYLPPRLLAPSRLWFRWLSAAHNDDVPGVASDFVEMNTHPSTSPVCGWVVPNHLDNSLFFYDADGEPIGSFGVEHGRVDLPDPSRQPSQSGG